MTIQLCAEKLQKGDPIRFFATMSAPVADRPVLFALGAFNLEVARAPWVTKEPMIAEMRLQFWADVIDAIKTGATPRAHEVAGPLAELVPPAACDLLSDLIEARRADIYGEGFADVDALFAYLTRTGGHLMAAGAISLGATDPTPFLNIGTAAALAAYLRAVPGLEDAGRHPLPDGTPAAVTDLARRGLTILDSNRKLPRLGRSAALVAFETRHILLDVLAQPSLVAADALHHSDLRRNLWMAATLWGKQV